MHSGPTSYSYTLSSTPHSYNKLLTSFLSFLWSFILFLILRRRRGGEAAASESPAASKSAEAVKSTAASVGKMRSHHAILTHTQILTHSLSPRHLHISYFLQTRHDYLTLQHPRLGFHYLRLLHISTNACYVASALG